MVALLSLQNTLHKKEKDLAMLKAEYGDILASNDPNPDKKSII